MVTQGYWSSGRVPAGMWIASDLDENALAVKQGHCAPTKGNVHQGEQQRRIGRAGERHEQPLVNGLLYGHAANVNVLDQLGDELGEEISGDGVGTQNQYYL